MQQIAQAKLAATLILTAILLQACAAPQQGGGNLVAQAYETSGIVTVKPYTRTIFSSNDF